MGTGAGLAGAHRGRRPAPRAPRPRPKPAPRAPRPRAPPSHGYPAPLAGYPDNYRRVTRLTYRVTAAANALSSI